MRACPSGFAGEQIDLVLANLPYVTDATIYERSPEIQREPRIAVTGDCGEDGLGVIRGLIAEVPPGPAPRRWSTTPTTARRCASCCARRERCGTTWAASG